MCLHISCYRIHYRSRVNSPNGIWSLPKKALEAILILFWCRYNHLLLLHTCLRFLRTALIHVPCKLFIMAYLPETKHCNPNKQVVKVKIHIPHAKERDARLFKQKSRACLSLFLLRRNTGKQLPGEGKVRKKCWIQFHITGDFHRIRTPHHRGKSNEKCTNTCLFPCRETSTLPLPRTTCPKTGHVYPVGASKIFLKTPIRLPDQLSKGKRKTQRIVLKQLQSENLHLTSRPPP